MSVLARLRLGVMAAVAVAAGVVVLAAVQSAGGDGEAVQPAAATATATEVPSARAAASPQPSATHVPQATPTSTVVTPTPQSPPTPTATPATATATPAPTRAAVRGPAACPVAQHICDLAVRYRALLVAGDIEGLVSSPRGYRVLCPAPAAASGPYPLCDGMPGGSALGFARTTFDSPDGASDREGQRQRFREWLGLPAGASSDALGPGDIRIASVGCGARTATEQPNCARELDLLLTRIAATGRTAILIRLTPADSFAGDGISGLATGKAPDLAYTGGAVQAGNANGALFASYAVLSAWAPADIGLP